MGVLENMSCGDNILYSSGIFLVTTVKTYISKGLMMMVQIDLNII